MSGAHFFLTHALPRAAYSDLDAGVPSHESEDEHQQQQQARRRQRDGDDEAGEGGEENSVRYRPCKDVQETYEELGLPGPRSHCFACRYGSQRRAAKVSSGLLQELMRLMAEGIGVSSPIALATEAATLYAKLREETNRERSPTEEPLREWSAASILDHWTTHTLDPEIIQWLDLYHIRYIMNRIRATSMERVDVSTGEEFVDREQSTIWRDYQRQFYFISSKDPRKLSYFFEGSMLDRRSVANGGISSVGRPVYDFVQKGSKRQRSAGSAVNFL